MSRDDADAASMGFRSSGEVSDWQRAQGTRQAEPVALSTLTDEQLLALNEGERFFSENPTKYPEAGHGTQYHAGAPGVVGFARAVLAASAPALQAGQGEQGASNG